MSEADRYRLFRWKTLDERELFYWTGVGLGVCVAGVTTTLQVATGLGLAATGAIIALLMVATKYVGGED